MAEYELSPAQREFFDKWYRKEHKRFEQYIWRLVRDRANDREETLEVAAEVFKRVGDVLAKEFRDQPIPENFTAWVRKFARNVVAEFYRRENRTKHARAGDCTTYENVDDGSHTRMCAQVQAQEELPRWWNELTPTQQAAFLVDNSAEVTAILPSEAVEKLLPRARELAANPGARSQAKFRARAKLRTLRDQVV